MGYYRKFLKMYGKYSSPLTSLLKKNSSIWNEVVEKAFSTLENAYILRSDTQK
jgi:hypothetical protein